MYAGCSLWSLVFNEFVFIIHSESGQRILIHREICRQYGVIHQCVNYDFYKRSSCQRDLVEKLGIVVQDSIILTFLSESESAHCFGPRAYSVRLIYPAGSLSVCVVLSA